MSDSIFLQNTETLSDLRNAFQKFSNNTQESITSIETEIIRTLAWIESEVQKCQQKVLEKERAVELAQVALTQCQNQQSEEYYADCSAEEIELRLAKRDLKKAEDDFLKAKEWKRKIEIYALSCKSNLRRLKELTTTKTGKLIQFLKNKLWILEQYQSVPLGNFSSFSQQSINLENSTFSENKLNSLTGGIISPNENRKWTENFLNKVNIDTIPLPEIDPEKDFQKVTLAEMKEGLTKLQEMQPLIESGEGNSKEYWADIDMNKGLDFPNGYQKIYESFYGGEPIRITMDGDSCDIINGRHRIWLAKQMGITYLPAVIVEQI